MKVYQNLKYLNNMSEGKHQKVIPSRLRCVCLAQSGPAFLSELVQLQCLGLGKRVCSIQQQTCHPVHTSPNSKTWARGMAERIQHSFSSSSHSTPCQSEMLLPQNHGAGPPSSPLAVGDALWGQANSTQQGVKRHFITIGF